MGSKRFDQRLSRRASWSNIANLPLKKHSTLILFYQKNFLIDDFQTSQMKINARLKEFDRVTTCNQNQTYWKLSQLQWKKILPLIYKTLVFCNQWAYPNFFFTLLRLVSKMPLERNMMRNVMQNYNLLHINRTSTNALTIKVFELNISKLKSDIKAMKMFATYEGK